MRKIISSILGAAAGTAAGFTGGFMISFLVFGDGSEIYFRLKSLGMEPYLVAVGLCSAVGLLSGGYLGWISQKHVKRTEKL
ncbi:MAG: hypothetical protein SCK29_09900 [Bacillota bacterium]|nr:hypothetical protein [Bacillota bacterium]MDW7684413.1 hypothetical protein [Bacillota bacterium]